MTFQLTRDNIVLNQAASLASISDGYHSLDDLYKHRIALFILLAKTYRFTVKVYRFHHYEGWFCLGMETQFGQISYHIPEKEWDKCSFAEERQPKFDGHTSEDVLQRIALFTNWIIGHE